MRHTAVIALTLTLAACTRPQLAPGTEPSATAPAVNPADFPLSDSAGASVDGVDSDAMRSMARHSDRVERDTWDARLADHQLYLDSGGRIGSWQTLSASGLTFGVQMGANATDGSAFEMRYKRFSAGLPTNTASLAFAAFTAADLTGLDFTGADLKAALLIDAHGAGVSFRGADLRRADLSRANLSGADFRGADFENCDLRGADFRGAKLEGSRFPGANLDGVRR
ncbi:MAG: hypothetical protein ACI9MR_001337 [Myxococcota bacterium]|jgi:uncharacterized protein YjbI with pentapeptide repeats